jgi:hypothetical protein
MPRQLLAIYVAAANGASNGQVSATNHFPDRSPTRSPDGLQPARVSESGDYFHTNWANPEAPASWR